MCPGVLKNGTPTGEPAGASPQCRECTAHGMRIGARGCTTEGICKTEDGHDLRRLGLLIVRNGSGTETAGRTEEEAEELLKTMMPRIRELLDPYININEILNRIRAAHENETPEPYIECEIIWNVYAVYSYINGKEIEDIERGIKRIQSAYTLAKQKFAEAAAKDPNKSFRKDGRTPLFAHSTRLAMMAAYLGARSDMITGLLCHDMVEDCGITSERIRKEIGKSDGHRIRVFVSLLTKPVLAKIRTEEGQMEVWVSYIENPLLWSTCTQLPCNNKYTERMNLHYDSILNADPTRAPADIRLQAFVGKMLDALDNLVTDEYLDAVNASLRLTVLVSQIRHLEVLAPGLRGIIVKLLKERDYTIPEEGIKRWKPAEGEIVMQPLVEKINVAVLDRMPAPNGYITVYAKDCGIDEELASGTFNKKIRVELPHTARPDSCEAIAEFFKTTHPNARLTFERGESLLPCGSEAAGTIIMVGGVNDAQKFEVLKTGLKAFYVVKPDIIGRAPNSAQSNEPKAHQDIPF